MKTFLITYTTLTSNEVQSTRVIDKNVDLAVTSLLKLKKNNISILEVFEKVS